MKSHYDYQFLEWDSNFFGFKVAIIFISDKNELELDQRLSLLKARGFTLVYVISDHYADFNMELMKMYDGRFVDEKVTYSKKVEGNFDSNINLISYDKSFPTVSMISLAIESGIFSRFKRDSRIGTAKFEELYRLWIINSVNHSIASEVLIYTEKENILGLITLSGEDKTSNIGIISVDSNSRGLGIGRILMHGGELWAKENGFNDINVVTQKDNIPACKLYEACGFYIKDTKYVYHFWLKN